MTDQAPLVPDDRHRLPEQPAAHRHRVREARRRRAGPLPPHGGVRRLLPDGQRREHRQGRRSEAAELGQDPQAYCDDMARQFREVWDALDISYDDFIQTSQRAAQAVLPEVHPEGVRQRPHLQGQLRGLVLRRLRGVQDREAARRERRPVPAPQARRSIRRSGAVLLLRAVDVPGPAAEASTRRTRTSSSRRAGGTRSSASSRTRGCRT